MEEEIELRCRPQASAHPMEFWGWDGIASTDSLHSPLLSHFTCFRGFTHWWRIACQYRRQVRSLWQGWGDILEREMATDSSILEWEIPWTEYPATLQFMELQRKLATKRFSD